MSIDLASWIERDNTSVIILKLSVSDPLLVYVENLYSSSTIWTCFKNLYSQKNKAKIIALKEELFKLHMKESNIVSIFIHKVISIRNDLLSVGATMSE